MPTKDPHSTMPTAVRVRYAPSPTGRQHIGGVRTALFNYLHAKSLGGSFVLRVEDTDPERSRPRFEQDLYEQLAWLGIRWDEGPDIGGDYGPYRSSERQALYRSALEQLIAQGAAYPCYCSPEELAAQRQEALASGRPPRYSGHCRNAEAREALRRRGRSPVIRFRVPEGRRIAFRDLIRGEVSHESEDVGDFSLYRSRDESLEGGRAFYNLAVVVDDHAMGISDVLRGEEHLSNTPRQLLLYEALGYSPPRFGHLSLIVSPDGSKLSKRHGDTSIDYYAQEGYLPEAIVAYTATLGWAPGRNPERNSLEDLISLFSLRRLSSNPSTFDEKRMEWFNQRRLQRAERGRIADLMRPRLSEAYGRWEAAEGTAHDRETWYCHLVGAAQEEATTLSDMVRLCAFALASERPEMSAEAAGTLEDQWAPAVLAAFLKELSEEALATPQSANEWLTGLRHAIRDSDGLRGRQVMFPIRAALTGSLRGPCLGIVTSLLGQSRCRERVEEVLKACQPPL
ncbi:MAG: glutamate--tRNA ligase [Chloroflexi bacterium]|nr:glutamate--tRNA ligase [Chloroflexota bacterium]